MEHRGTAHGVGICWCWVVARRTATPKFATLAVQRSRINKYVVSFRAASVYLPATRNQFWRFERLKPPYVLAAVALAATGLLTPLSAFADEPLFGYVYTTDLLPKGKFELAQWATWRTGKSVGQFDVLEGRSEFEFGATDRFQLSAYLNYEWARAARDNVIDGTTLAPATLANLDVRPADRLNTTRFTGVSVEGIYRIWSPYTNPVGIALYARPTVGAGLRELESRLIVQKNFLDDRMVLAFNITMTDDWRDVPKPGAVSGTSLDHAWAKSSGINLGLAGSYRFASGWSAGMELENERGYAGSVPFGASSRTDVAYYLGPSLHYANEHLFVTASYLEQLPLASDYAHTSPDFVVDGRTYAANFERRRVRLKFGWYF